MRNLKKILALVLALVMSLSLMATASAANFKDASEINEKYQTAVEVLEGLGVFRGYDENGSYSFKPTGEITRAETAAIIYRIVTGDVKDEQVAIYRDYGLFTDVPATAWYAGYVNFCANAKYIVGDGKGHFNPSDKVEGYAALAMILRAIGYTANGGFTGSDWRTQTARVGESRKVTKNITSGTLGVNADRQTVAEILYQAIMVDMVDHNADYAGNGEQGYYTVPQTLGQKIFGLEYVSGVILANEWANLEGDTVLAADTTMMKVTDTYATESKYVPARAEDDLVLTLNDKTETEMQAALDAVGMTYDAHLANPSIKGSTGTAEVLTLKVNPINNVAYNVGKGVYPSNDKNGYLNNATWPSIEKFADAEAGIGLTGDTEWFINYEEKWDANCMSYDRISYAISKADVAADADWQKYIDQLLEDGAGATIPTPANSTYPGHYLAERTVKIDLDLDGNTDGEGESVPCWVVAIRPENPINLIDQDIMMEIFYTADRIGTNGVTGSEIVQNYAIGEVYVGTTSMRDYSDEMNWRDFQAKYFVRDENTRKFDTCAIGNSLRVIDNNGDGDAEYVLRIDYTQDKVIGTYKGQPAGYNRAIGNYEGNLLYNPEADKIEQGTVFNYTVIDKKLYVWPAPVVTGVAATKDFNHITITVDGEVYNQSGIKNETRLDENIMLMQQNTTYNMYMDVYGNNVRSYELAQGSKWALLTEMYPTTDKNGNYIRDFQAIAEVKIQDADVDEYPVNGSATNLNRFFNPYIWTWATRGYYGVNPDPSGVVSLAGLYQANYLQPAVAHLGIGELKNNSGSVVVSPAVDIGSTNNDPAVAGLQTWYSASWYRAVAQVDVNGAPANGEGGTYGVFNYGTENVAGPASNPTFSFTNVAAYVDNDGTLTLRSASKLSTSRTSGDRLYRVGDTADTGVKSATITGGYLWQIGTEKELVDSFNAYIKTVPGMTVTINGQTYTATSTADDTQGQAWFDHFANAATYGNGNGIYPVYESDYVQLDLTKGDMGQALVNDVAVKAGTRHYHIANTNTDANGATISNYPVAYNTNANSYVDATINTEFYIVLPGGKSAIQYKLGYDELPTILSENIRAAYAVAHNTSAQNDGQDYWVADVIVIELDELTYDYDSISLVYNNPYVQNGYTRYADTLNNDWRTLQPDYDGLAKMGITPKDGDFTTTTWGTRWGIQYSWSKNDATANYGFWKLYNTELTTAGQLNVGDAKKIVKGEYNDHGIYAGRITRVEELEESGYLDVSVRNTGWTQTYAIDVNYAKSNEVPFYRITRTQAMYGNIYTATLMNPNQSLRWSDIKNGDEIIWVYDQTNPKQLAFVIDLGDRFEAIDGFDYDASATVGWLDALWTAIEDETVNGMPATKDITVSAKVAAPAPTGLTANDPIALGTSVTNYAKGETAKIVKADLAKAGYEVVSVVADGVTLASDATYYLIPNIQANTVVEVTYAEVTKTLTVAKDTTVSTGDADNIEVNEASWTNGDPCQVGTVLNVTFEADPAYTYTYKVNSENPVKVTNFTTTGGTTTGSFTVNMPDANTTITITDTARDELTITATPAANTTITFTQATIDAADAATGTFDATTGGDTFTDAVVSFTVAVTPGQNVALDKVYYQTIASNGPQEINAEEGVYTVPANVVAEGNDITITTTTTNTAPYSVTLALGTGAEAVTGVEYLDPADGGWKAVATANVSVPRASGKIEFRSMKKFQVAVTGSNATVDATSTDYRVTVTVTGNDTLTIKAKA